MNGDELTTKVDHSYDALMRSIDRSIERLRTIDLLQIHKATVSVLENRDLWKALDYARSLGIGSFGASVVDVETGRLACESDSITTIQMPFNLRIRGLEELFGLARRRGKRIWTNRPFAMGALIHEDQIALADAYRFILAQDFDGVVLTGTSSVRHLEDDWAAFHLQVSGSPIPRR